MSMLNNTRLKTMAVADGVVPTLALRSSVAVELWSSAGAKQPYEHKPNLPREETKSSRSICFSPDGRHFAYSNGVEVKVLRVPAANDANWEVECKLPRPKAFYLKFSPRGNYLCTWEHYAITKDRPEGSANLLVYEIATGTEVFAIVQKNQTDWEPSWSSDESIFALVVGGEALFYDLGAGTAGFASTSRKIGGSRGGMLSLGPGHCPPFLAFYTPGAKGAPSMCKLYKYPALAQNQTVACKSFFQADRVDMLWNKRGTGVLLVTSTEVDKTGASYYGNQALHFMATKGDTCSVPLSKEGPVHSVKWSPKATEFVVVYGFMPSKAALYNLKCDVIFDFGEGPRNSAYFNPFGNLIALAGFGNLPGAVEVWDVSKRERLANLKCADTTHFEWHPNGEWFVTATTAPRLRISNGFKIYHYSGALLHETLWPQGQELLGLEWQQYPDNTFAEPKITKAKHEGIKSSQPEASKKAYTPPHLRLLKEGKNPEKYLPQPTVPGLAVQGGGGAAAGSAANNKNKRKNNNNNINKTKGNNNINNKREAGDANATTAAVTAAPTESQESFKQNPRPRQQQQHHHTQQQQSEQSPSLANGNVGHNNHNNSNNNSEKDRKIRSVAKKLSDIKKLKSRQSQGETLELNQLNKIEMEASYLDELKALKLSA
ncbi:eukaryotic translation initiation factor 2A isoform X2 [Drosophila busckii]|uniref:eukaryotic translation initiation factor 2A isoform X2 n=1 Tax=Drosophila busckii TaxID=30019 RepID=UPI00083EE063|nr:eukaryotic translation initiation factor 2A isoform X2 [Drosophila busckii]